MITVAEYYANKTIFLTGATGFIGKVLIEKLLRSCPNIKKIFCLIRPKRGKSAAERLERMLEEPLYDNLRTHNPDFVQRVQAVHGDVLEDGFGLKDKDRTVLEEEVQIVIHSAATVRFDEHLRLALEMNVLGTRKAIVVCRKFKKLEVFLHVSTAYSNCDRKYIEEVTYPPPIEPQRLFDALEWLDDDMLTAITPKLLGDKPNTYTYTKHLAETILMQEGSDLPLAIVRPSIVTASWKEPIPGWIDNWNGPSGLYIAAGKGILRSVRADHETVADFIPVDFLVNMMVTIPWHTVVCKPKKNAVVYHITSGTINPVRWGDMESVVLEYFKKHPLDACYRRPNCTLTKTDWVNNWWVLISHMIPAYFVDLGYLLMGKKPRMVNIYNKLHKAINTLDFFITSSWEWTHDNADILKASLSPEDQRTFYFDPREMHWPLYLENYCMGTKKFVLKEDMSGLPAARAHLRKLRNIRYTFNAVLLIVLWRLLIARSQIARNSWYLITGLIYKFVQFFRLTSTINN